MPVVAVTGSASGIGAATATLLRANGARVIGVDLADADVLADLGTPHGRSAAIAEITAACDGRLDGLVTAAGIGGSSTEHGGRLVAVNYFGSIALVEGLRAALTAAGRSAVVCVASNSITCQPDWPVAIAEACLDGDEDKAVALADEHLSLLAYPAAKAAIAWWMRSHAHTPEWAGAGIRLNAIAPGLIDTPLTDKQLQDPVIAGPLSKFPVPRGVKGRPDEVAAVIDFMLSPAAALLYGSVIFADGGTDAMLRTRDWPAPWHLEVV